MTTAAVKAISRVDAIEALAALRLQRLVELDAELDHLAAERKSVRHAFAIMGRPEPGGDVLWNLRVDSLSTQLSVIEHTETELKRRRDAILAARIADPA